MAYDIDALVAELGDIPVQRDPALLKQKSRDFYWYSPVLKRQLRGVCADLIVKPQSEADVLKVLKLCHAHDIPVTPRGTGTGNYGQAMPLSGGVLLDLSEMTKIKEIGMGRVVCEPGGKMLELEREIRERSKQEFRMHPSTHRTATVGGFIAGGSGGVGSITHGGLRDRGSDIRLRVATMEAEPRSLELTGDDIQKANHAYGTTGVITEVELPLAPAYNWVDVIVGFDDFLTCARFSNDFARQDAMAKKLSSAVAAPLPHDWFAEFRDMIPAGKSVCLAMVADFALDAFLAFTKAFGKSARILYRSDADHGGRHYPPVYELSWNHTTLQGLKVNKDITYLQVLYPFPNQLDLVAKCQEHFGDEVIHHLEFVRFNGDITCFGLPIVRFTTEERLEEIMREHEALGCPIFNPHRYTLEEGGMKMTDKVQLAFKREADPKGLLNPGKMVAWEDPEWDFSTARTYLFPSIAQADDLADEEDALHA
jgi:FAD/FMN-containing dehydrogenase